MAETKVEYSKRWRVENPELAKAKNKKDNAARLAREQLMDPLELAAIKAKYRARSAAKRASWRKANSDKAALASRKWAMANPGRVLAMNSTYRARRRAAVAAWESELTTLVTEEASNLVAERKLATGLDWHIDHILPLRGRKVSGLHVWNNLQVIPAKTNRMKHNHYEVT